MIRSPLDEQDYDRKPLPALPDAGGDEFASPPLATKTQGPVGGGLTKTVSGAPTGMPSKTLPAFNYEGARDDWMSGRYALNEQGARDWAMKHGINYTGGDTITLPNGGGAIDIIGNYAGGRGNGQAMRANWTPAGGNGPNAGGGGPSAYGGAGTGGFAGGGGFGSGLPGGPGGDLEGELRTQLLSLMKGGTGPIDAANDPRAKAYRVARERGAAQQRAAAAERAAAGGLLQGGAGSGAFDAGVQGILEGAGQDIAANEAQVANQELMSQRDQKMNALQLANALGARKEAAQLQRELAEMDRQLRYAQLGQQQSQWNDQYGLSRADLEQRSNRDALLAALG